MYFSCTSLIAIFFKLSTYQVIMAFMCRVLGTESKRVTEKTECYGAEPSLSFLCPDFLKYKYPNILKLY